MTTMTNTTPVPIHQTDDALSPIIEKVHAEQRLTADDGMLLYETRDVWTVCSLADLVRRRLHGNDAFYNINRHMNYSNVCALSCKFCDFYRKKDQEGAYEHSLEDIEKEATIAKESGATEIHIVGGLHLTDLRSERYDDLFFTIEEAQLRLQEIASIMGMVCMYDELPPAA